MLKSYIIAKTLSAYILNLRLKIFFNPGGFYLTEKIPCALFFVRYGFFFFTLMNQQKQLGLSV